MKGGKKNVTISSTEYKQLISRPKSSTLARDKGLQLRKGKIGNPYSQTLLNPTQVTGVKVPDVTSFPTSTFQAYDRIDLTIGANTSIAVAFQPVLQDFFATCTNLNGATAFGNWAPQAQAAAVNSLYHSYRPVSACFRMWTNANATQNSGELAAAYLAKDQTLAVGTMGTFDLIAKRFGAFRAPLRDGVEILWMPQDPTSRMYLLSGTGTSDQAIGSNWPGLVIGISGSTTGSVVSFEAYVNYEAIPELSTINLVNASAPYVSNKDLEEATGMIGSMGTFGRALGQDLSSWVFNQGVSLAGDIGRHVATGAVHYMASRIGMHGQRSRNVILG
jgi:hypothetical protein